MEIVNSSPGRGIGRRLAGAAAALSGFLLLSSAASAQSAPGSPPAHGASAGGPSAAGATAPWGAGFAEAPQPDVSDPMLALPPPAPRQIGSWDDALSLIRSQSPDYATAYQSVVRAEAQKRIVLGAILPTLIGQGAYTHQFYTATFTIPGFPPIVSPPKDLWTASASLSWQAINPREIYAVGTAAKNVDVTKLSFEDQRRQIAISVVHTMLATLAASRVAEVNRVSLRAALGRLALTLSRQQFGQGTALDVDRGQQDVESSRRLIISGDEALLQAREALGAALGSPEPIAPPGDLDLDQFEAAIGRTCHMNDELDRRPDVAAARGRVDLAQRSVHDAELLFSPSIAVGSQFADNNVAVLGPTKTWDVGAVLTVPLYDGGVRYGALHDARAALEQARQALVATRLAALVGSEQARRLVGVQQASREVSRRQVDDAQRIDDRTRSGYANGLGTSLDLVTSAQSLRQAQIDLAILDYQVAEARADAVLINAECLY